MDPKEAAGIPVVVLPPVQLLDPVHTCGMRLLNDAGKPTGPVTVKLPDLYRKYSLSKDDEFIQYMLSVIYVESRFRKEAKSHADAYGLMQMTAAAAEAAQSKCNLRPLPTMDHLFDSVTNIKYGSCYLKMMLDEAEGDWIRALILYNGGYRQLTRYDRGENIANETANYVIQVHRALRYICRTKGN